MITMIVSLRIEVLEVEGGPGEMTTIACEYLLRIGLVDTKVIFR